jgi:hypothetical protein
MISETRQLLIKNKIISFDDVFKLATIAYEEYRKGKSDENDSWSEFSLSTICDDSSFNSSDISLLEKNSPLQNKRPLKISISAAGRKPEKWMLEIELNQWEGARSYVLIESHDSIWVNGFLARFQDTVSAFKPQNTIVRDHTIALVILASIGFGCILSPFIIGFANMMTNPNPTYIPSHFDLLVRKYPVIYYLVTTLMSSVVGTFPGVFMVNKLKTLWPSLELAIGPEHTQIEKKRRNWILGFIVLVIIPLVVSIVYDLLKTFTIGKT